MEGVLHAVAEDGFTCYLCGDAPVPSRSSPPTTAAYYWETTVIVATGLLGDWDG